MLEIGAAPYALSEKDIVSIHGETIKKVVREEIESEVQYERLLHVMQALRNWHYYQGKQYIVPDSDLLESTYTIGFRELTAPDGREMFRSVYNIYESDGRGFIGAVAPRAPNAKAVPDNPEVEDNVRFANDADAMVRDLWRKWKVNTAQRVLAENAWITGPSFIQTVYNADGHRYGFIEEPTMNVVDEFAEDGTPTTGIAQGEKKKYPKGDVEMRIYDSLYVTIPFNAKTQQEVGWLSLDTMDHKAILFDLYGEELEQIAETYRENQDSDKQAVLEAQQRASNPSGTVSDTWKKRTWHHQQLWVRPAYFTLFRANYTGQDGGEYKLSETLKEQFPDGLKLCFVNGQLVKVLHERLDDIWSICKAGTGQYIMSPPWGNSTIPVQDDLNHCMNMSKEILLRTVVKTVVDPQLIDREAMKRNQNILNEVVFARPGAAGKLREMMAEFPQAKMPDQLPTFISMISDGIARRVNSVTEALTGAGEPANTYRAEKQRRDQSMSKFAPFVEETKDALRNVARNGVIQRARYGVGSIEVEGEDGFATRVDQSMLSETGWHVEVEEGIPMSFSEESDRLIWLLTENSNPDLYNALGVLEPEARQELRRMVGLNHIKPRDEDIRNKVHSVIAELLKTPPITDPMTGMVQPAIPIDEFEADHQLEAEIVRAWCNSKIGQAEKKRNPEGYEHVKAWGEAHQQRANEMAAPPPQPGQEPPPEGEQPPPEGEAAPLPEGVEQPNPEPPPGQQQPQPFNTAPPQI